MNPDPRRRRLLVAAGAIGGLPAWPRAAAAAAASTAGAGPVVDGVWHDAARSRELPWRLRLPAPAARRPWPGIVYSHGLGGSRAGGGVWGQAWAAAGFAVLHLQHPGSDVEVARRGLAALRAAADGLQLLARVGDVRFALDEAERRRAAGEGPWANLDGRAVGVAGHSFGAHTVQAAAGQRFPVGPPLADARPLAFVALSPGPARDSSSLAEVRRPFFCATGSLDADPFGRHAGGTARAAVFDALPPGHRALLWLEGADHATFGGGRGGRGDLRRPLREAVATQREEAHEALIAQTTTLWWRARLQGDEAALVALRRPDGLRAGDRMLVD